MVGGEEVAVDKEGESRAKEVVDTTANDAEGEA